MLAGVRDYGPLLMENGTLVIFGGSTERSRPTRSLRSRGIERGGWTRSLPNRSLSARSLHSDVVSANPQLFPGGIPR